MKIKQNFNEFLKKVTIGGKKVLHDSSYYDQKLQFRNFFHSCTVHLDTIESFIYPTDAQLDCSKNVKIYIKMYMRGAPTCFNFSQPSSGSYYMCFAKAISINHR